MPNRIPPALALRLDHLRQDEGAREELQRKVEADKQTKLRRRRSPRGTSAVPSPRSARRIPAADSAIDGQPPPPPMTGEEAPLVTGGTSAPLNDDLTQRMQQLTPQSHAAGSQRRRLPSPLVTHLPPMPNPGQLPPIPKIKSAHIIERARALTSSGGKALDPLQQSTAPEAALIRTRTKRLELAHGHFHTGSTMTETERAMASMNTVPLEVTDSEALKHAQRMEAVADRMKRTSARDFVTASRVPSTLAQDTDLLSDHRTPYVDMYTRDKESGRKRDKNAELSPRSIRIPPPVAPFSPPSTALPPDKPLLLHGGRHREHIDDIEIRAARALLSKGLSIYRRGDNGVSKAQQSIGIGA